MKSFNCVRIIRNYTVHGNAQKWFGLTVQIVLLLVQLYSVEELWTPASLERDLSGWHKQN